MVHSPVSDADKDPDFFDIVTGVSQGDTLAPYLFIFYLDSVLRTPKELIKNGFILKETRSRQYPVETMMDTDYADDLPLLSYTHVQPESLLYGLEWVEEGNGLSMKADKTKFILQTRRRHVYFMW